MCSLIFLFRDYAVKNVKWIGLLPSGNPKQKNTNSNIKSTSTNLKDENQRLFKQEGEWMLIKELIVYLAQRYWRVTNKVIHLGNAIEFWSGRFYLLLTC